MNGSRKTLSPAGLLAGVYELFEKTFADKKKRRHNDPSLVDCLMSCVAMLHLKFPSLLQFDNRCRIDTLLTKNVKKLYHVENLPSDTTMREKLDLVEPDNIRGTFRKIFAYAQRGKVLEQFEFWDGHYLVSVDGTVQFASNKVKCDNCYTQYHSSGDITYSHRLLAGVIVHPDMKQVIPLAPEAIKKADGSKKNDCEANAATRLLQDLRREHPHLKLIISLDSLYSNGPIIRLLQELDMDFIISAKPGSLPKLYDWIENIGFEEHSHFDAKGKRHDYKFVNRIPLNESNSEMEVNFLEYWETDQKGKVQHFAWITAIPLTKETAELVMRGGRARWRIENETFNTLKNQGYNFEHNYGHGCKNLCTVMGMLMMMAFLIDQISELCDAAYSKAKRATGSYSNLWNNMRAVLTYLEIASSEDLLNKIILHNTSRTNTS